MKKILVILSLAALFASCSKNSDVKPALTPKTVTAADIMGTWKLTTDTAYASVNGQLVSTVNASPTGGTITYGQNGMGTATTNNTTTSFNYSVTDGVIVVNINDQSGDFIILHISSTKMLTKVTGGVEYVDEVFIKQ